MAQRLFTSGGASQESFYSACRLSRDVAFILHYKFEMSSPMRGASLEDKWYHEFPCV
jgi:hypothetical protein